MLTYRAGENLDPGTLWLIQQSQGTTLAVGQYRLKYIIPGAVLRMAEPLRSRTYLPFHKLNQDPVLTLQWQSLANIIASAGAINNLFCDVVLIRREPTVESEAALAANAIPGGNIGGDQKPTGYIDWDLIEQPFNVAPGISNEQRFFRWRCPESIANWFSCNTWALPGSPAPRWIFPASATRWLTVSARSKFGGWSPRLSRRDDGSGAICK